MYAVTVEFTIKTDCLAAFMPLMLENARASVAQEPGCQQFDVCQDDSNPDLIFLYEIYDDEAAFDAHTQMPHFAHFNAVAGDMIADKAVKIFGKVMR